MLPQNRRLRHLQGIYLRNLSFSVNRARAIDDLDADLRPNNHNNNQNNYNNITTNNNNNDLTAGYSEDIHGSSDGGQPPDHAPQLQKSQSSESLRPRPNGRRRSTTLAHVSPVTRQKQLEYAVESRAADVFFSLHCEGVDDPIYISEVGERAMNFNFRFFDLDSLGPFVTRSSVVIVKIWAKRWQKWGLLLQQHVDLRSLNYIGTLRSHQFPPNCLVFHLTDGIYSLDLSSERPEPKQGPGLPSSSYNALMKLSNLDNSIQDALATRESLTAQINEILERAPSSSPHTDVPRAQESALLASRYVNTQKRTLKAAQARQADLRASIEARRRAIAEGREAQARAEADVQHARSQLPASRAQVATTREAIRGQRRRICEDLARIFPIVPDTGPLESPLSSSVSSAAPPSPLAFRICGIPLPNTDYDPTSSSSTEDSLSAALGYVAHLADLLQYYLSVPLPYPLTPFGSRSSVRDDISLLPDTSSMSSSTVTSYATSSSKHVNPASSGSGGTTARQRYYQRHQQRDFPLFLRGGATAQYRFDYAWFLLNKDIEALCAAAGRHQVPGGSPMRVVDLRHTLPNLKYLLYVCTAGSDDVPERKRGGVRGLWAGRMKSRVVAAATAAARGSSSNSVGAGALTPDDAGSAAGSSRRGSTDSEALGVGAGARSQEQLKQAMAGVSSHKENGAASSRVRDSGVGGLDPSGDEGRRGRRRSPSPDPEPLGLLPFEDGAPRLTLRTKGLRENVGAHA